MPDIHGNIDGIRNSVLEEMQQMYDFPIGRDEFLPMELAQILAAYSHELRREISLYISRAGEVLDITIGSDNQVSLKEFRLRRSERRLSRVRCIHTHPGGSAELSDVDITALRALWLDSIAAIGIDKQGEIIGISAAFLGEKMQGIPQVRLSPVVSLSKLPSQRWMEEISRSETLVTQGEDLEEDPVEKALLVGIESEESREELAALWESAGGIVVGKVLQKRARPDGATYIGSGRAEQLSLEAQVLEANLIIVDDELTGIQINKLEEITGLKVIDRTTLILDIFARRASSSEGKLQVELAQLNYNSTRLIGSRQALSRLAGGIGTRGPGESKLEIDRRRIRERMADLRRELKELEQQRAIRRKSRERSQLPVVALVGYTNTGKSTLLNLLSGADVYVKNELFATLDAVSRRVDLPDGDAFILIDSVGFIRKLPTELVEAFHSTLEEAVLADVLVIVSDASSPDVLMQHEVVEQVLQKLGATAQPRIEVLNKSDIHPDDGYPVIPGALRISAATGENVDTLMEQIAKIIRSKERNYEVMVPFSQYALLNDLRQAGRVMQEIHEDEGTRVQVMLDAAAAGRLKNKYGQIILRI